MEAVGFQFAGGFGLCCSREQELLFCRRRRRRVVGRREDRRQRKKAGPLAEVWDGRGAGKGDGEEEEERFWRSVQGEGTGGGGEGGGGEDSASSQFALENELAAISQRLRSDQRRYPSSSSSSPSPSAETQLPWDQTMPARLFIPEDLMTDPVFIWEVQGLMVQYFRGRLDERHIVSIEEFLASEDRRSPEESQRSREGYREAAIKAIKSDPTNWLLRSWKSKTPIEVDGELMGPFLDKGLSVEDIQQLSMQPPSVDPAVLEELDELALEMVVKENKELQIAQGINFAVCKKCGREVKESEIFEYGICELCARTLSQPQREKLIRTLTTSDRGADDRSREWPREPRRKMANLADPITRYVTDSNVVDLIVDPSKVVWFLGGDPAVYSEDIYPDTDEANTLANVDLTERYALLRNAVAELSSTEGTTYEAGDVVLAVGAHGALRAALQVLCSPGDNVLVPVPPDGVYESVAEELGIEVRYYHLIHDVYDPDRAWGLDLAEFRRKVDDLTRAVIVGNPNRVAGYLHTEQELRDILAVSREMGLPIVADEVLGDCVFQREWFPALDRDVAVPNTTFHRVADLAGGSSMVLTLGEISHRFPTALNRLGWLTLSGTDGVFSEEVRQGLQLAGTLQFRPLSGSMLGDFLPFLDRAAVERAELTVRNTCLSIVNLIKMVHRPEFACTAPSAGNSVLVRVDAARLGFHDATALTTYLLGSGIGIVPGAVLRVPSYCFLQSTGQNLTVSACFQLRIELDKRLQEAEAHQESAKLSAQITDDRRDDLGTGDWDIPT